MITREDLVKLAREAAGGIHRPPADCEGTYSTPWGTTETVLIQCEHTIRNPASYDPPEWVLEAMERAYKRGVRDATAVAMEASFAIAEAAAGQR